MKPLIQYNFKCLNAMYDYLQGGEISEMIVSLIEVENHAISRMDGDRYGESLWFKFSPDDTLVTDIKDIEVAMRFDKAANKLFLIESMAYACKNNTLEVYFS